MKRRPLAPDAIGRPAGAVSLQTDGKTLGNFPTSARRHRLYRSPDFLSGALVPWKLENGDSQKGAELLTLVTQFLEPRRSETRKKRVLHERPEREADAPAPAKRL
ncbi:MAG: hypothetical protein Tsb008_08070 [Rhodothalassiaceae bacterium]